MVRWKNNLLFIQKAVCAACVCMCCGCGLVACKILILISSCFGRCVFKKKLLCRERVWREREREREE